MTNTLTNPIGRPRKYAFAEMQAGESLFLPSECDSIRAWQRRITSAAAGQAGKSGCFTVVQRKVKGVIGVRVTRTG